MTGGNDILEYEEANAQELAAEFVEIHEEEFIDWMESHDYHYDIGQPSEEHEELFNGLGWTLEGELIEDKIYELMVEFGIKHKDWGRYVEERYSERGA